MYVIVSSTKLEEVNFNLFAQDKETIVYDNNKEFFILRVKSEYEDSDEVVVEINKIEAVIYTNEDVKLEMNKPRWLSKED